MPLLDLATVASESFIPLIGQTFEVIFADGRVPLILQGANPVGSGAPGGGRQPFALTFHGEPKWKFPQQIYRLEHPSMGIMDIFLVQVSADAKAVVLEAVFG